MGAMTVVATVAAIHPPTIHERTNARIDERVDGPWLSISIDRLTD
jgi:hypothetical protein